MFNTPVPSRLETLEDIVYLRFAEYSTVVRGEGRATVIHAPREIASHQQQGRVRNAFNQLSLCRRAIRTFAGGEETAPEGRYQERNDSTVEMRIM